MTPALPGALIRGPDSFCSPTTSGFFERPVVRLLAGVELSGNGPKKSLNDSVKRLVGSIFVLAATQACACRDTWCDSKVNALNNPGVSPNWYNIFLSRISLLIHFVSRVNLEAEV